MLTISLLLIHSGQKPTFYSDRPVPKCIYCWVLSLSLNPPPPPIFSGWPGLRAGDAHL